MKNFIICLCKIEESFNSAKILKEKLNQFNIEAELFEGTYGHEAVKIFLKEERELHNTGIKGNLIDKTTSKMNLPGVKGCFLSHYRLWEKCVELNEPITIWEDDIEISRNFFPVEWEDVLILALGHPRKSQRYIHLLNNNVNQEFKALKYKQSSMPGTCGYAIKPKAAEKLLETYKKTYLSSDNCINKHVVSIQIHSHIMGIARTKLNGKKSLTKTKMWEKYV